MIKELEDIVLTTALPEYGLEAGDIGTVVLLHQEGRACEVEFMTLTGKTIAVLTLRAKQVRPVSSNEIAHVRVVVN